MSDSDCEFQDVRRLWGRSCIYLTDHPPHHETERPVEQHGTFWIFFIHFSYLVGYDFFFLHFLFIYVLFLIIFFFCTNTICAACRNNCGHCGASTSCEEVPNCNTSEAGRSVSHQRCCRCSSGESQMTFNKNIKIVWKVDWSRVVSLCVWADVPRCSAILSDYYRAKLHSASGKEQVRIHHTLGQSLQKNPSFINVTDLSMYPLKSFSDIWLGIVLLWHTSLIRVPKSQLLQILG